MGTKGHDQILILKGENILDWTKILCNKKKQNKTDSRLEELERVCQNMRKELESAKRILAYAERGKVTYYSYNLFGFYNMSENTYFYKDFCEYKIKDLYLYNAKIIEENMIDGIIQVIDIDEENEVEYIVNLREGSYIKTRTNSISELHREQ